MMKYILYILSVFYAINPVTCCASPPTVHFTDISIKAGLSSLKAAKSYAAAVADYNHDGYPDFVISHHGYITLWQNDTQGRFVNSSHLLPEVYADTHGISFVDLNNDGFQDIAVACGAERGRGDGENIYFLNENGEQFTLFNAPSVLKDIWGRSRSITPTDINADGFTDLLLFNYYQKDRPHRVALGCDCDGHFIDGGGRFGIEQIRSFALRPSELNNDGNIYYIATGPDIDSGKIFQLQKGRLVDVSSILKIEEEYAIASIPVDFDNDGDFDLLFLHRNFSKPYGVELQHKTIFLSLNYFYNHITQFGVSSDPSGNIIDFDLTFEGKKRRDLIFLGQDKKLMSANVSKIDTRDTNLTGMPTIGPDEFGLFVYRDEFEAIQFVFQGSQDMQTVVGEIIMDDAPKTFKCNTQFPKPVSTENSFYRNDSGRFTKIADAAGLGGNGLGFDAIAADFNNDGWQDIYQVNAGHSFQESNPANLLFINNGNGSFSETAFASNAQGPKDGAGNTSIAFDYDRDGDLDILLVNGFVKKPISPGPVVLLRNDGVYENKLVEQKLRTKSGNLQGWGGKVMVERTNNRTMLQKNGYTGYLATSDLPIYVIEHEISKTVTVDNINLKKTPN